MPTKYKYPMHLQPNALGSFRNWMRLVTKNGVSPRHIPKALYVTFSSLVTTPLRLLETLRYDKKVRDHELGGSPLFILGHWRSGTTHLHNLMVQDKQFGFFSTFLASVPCVALIGDSKIKPILQAMVPETRPQDNMPLDMTMPQEEELAMPNMFPHSFYNFWYFPFRGREYFDKYLLFDTATEQEKKEWKEDYLYILKKASYNMGGRPLILKNPVNTGRIKMLLELFPDAKFIHIYRNPYAVYPSTRKLYDRIMGISTFHSYGDDMVEEYIFEFYTRMMERYFEDCKLIPEGNLVEVKYEDLIADRLAGLERIYSELALPGFDEALPNFQAYIDDQASYKRNRFALPADVIEKVSKHWQFAIDKWGYEVPEELKGSEK